MKTLGIQAKHYYNHLMKQYIWAGVSDSKGQAKIILDRFKVARRTKYALMGSGVHGTNGLDPKTSYQIYNTYVLPRLLYGLEVLPLKTTHIHKLEDFHRKTIRFLQSLPQRTSIAAIYLLLGALPLQAEYHKKQLSLLYSLLACENNKIHTIIIRQISVNYDNTTTKIASLPILEMYYRYICMNCQQSVNCNISYQLNQSGSKKLKSKSIIIGQKD